MLVTLRFLRLNERKISLVAIRAVALVMQRLSIEAATSVDHWCAMAPPEGGFMFFFSFSMQ